MARTLRHAEARAHYDRLGAAQDKEAWYEDPALDLLVAHGGFEEARHVVEFGCGTGRFAERLLAERLPADARYLGIDISATMVGLARGRLARFGGRCAVRQSDGDVVLPVGDGAIDRVVATFVLDLLPEPEAAAFVREARRVLAPDGRLCIASTTWGRGVLGRSAAGLYAALSWMAPSRLGGCRPIRSERLLEPAAWRLLYRGTTRSRGISCEILAARPSG